MARTASMTTSEAEALLGPRGALPFKSEHRGNLRKWLTAQGFPALFTIGLSIKEMTLAYNDTAGEQLNAIRRKLESGNELRDQEEAAAAETKVVGVDVDETGAVQAVVEKGKGHKVISALEELIESATGVDETKVREIIREELKTINISVSRIEVKQRSGQITSVDGHFHPNFPTLCKMAISFNHISGYVDGILISGEAGSGKTYSCKMLAKALNLPWHFNGAISMPHEMLGFIDAAGNYHTTPFREAYEHGGVYTFDEVDRSDPVALLAVNPHLANGVATFPDRQVIRHPNCIITATANTWGTGANAQYSGATKLDGAFLDRFPQRLFWNIDEAFELHLSGNEQWCKRVQHARRKAREHGLKVMITPRMTFAGAAQIACGGFTEDQAAENTYLANLSADQRRQVEAI